MVDKPEIPTNAPLPPGHPQAGDDDFLEDLPKKDLSSEAMRRGVNVEGTGKGGAVLKEDLIEALENTPEPPRGRPPLAQVAEALAAPFAPGKED